jgi:hypothetical protein
MNICTLSAPDLIAMNEAPFAPCLHCEAAPQEHYLRLCLRCARVKGIRLLYKKTSRWTPAWDEHLQRLVERARARLPLFPEEPAKENRNEEQIEKVRSA